MPESISLSVLLINEGGLWVAQGLEYDIAAQGKTIKEACDALGHTVVCQMALDIRNAVRPLSKVPQAPQNYWDCFSNRSEKLEDRIPIRIPDSIPTPRLTLGDRRLCDGELVCA